VNGPRFFVDQPLAAVQGREIALPDAVAQHAARALRLAAGDPIVLFDGRGGEWTATLSRPLLTERSQRARSDERADRRRAHWQSIAVAACEQCGRNRVPEVTAPTSLDAFLDDETSAPIALAAPGADRSLAELARQRTPRSVVIGPEGGFSSAEVERAAQRGVHLVGLGPRVLRAETAAIAALAMLAAVAGDAR
jgi:16S rRNA (uracil1498-N3)-methyltransferase